MVEGSDDKTVEQDPSRFRIPQIAQRFQLRPNLSRPSQPTRDHATTLLDPRLSSNQEAKPQSRVAEGYRMLGPKRLKVNALIEEKSERVH